MRELAAYKIGSPRSSEIARWWALTDILGDQSIRLTIVTV
jgi:hypothetical protein